MTLLWLLLILAVLGVVGVVASGYGGGMSTPEPDRPPLGLPPGPMHAEDLDAVRFSTAVRGYRMDQVDVVLDRLRAELAARDDLIAELRHGAGHVEEQPAVPEERPATVLEKRPAPPRPDTGATAAAEPVAAPDRAANPEDPHPDRESPWRS